MKIAFLGPEGSYSHLAAKAFLESEKNKQGANGGWDECIPFRNFAEVLAAVESGKTDAAALPIENSLQGGVSQNLDLLQAMDDMYAMKEYVLPLEHHLIYKEGVKLSEIGRVYSHRQALDQCLEYLDKEMPFASLRETESTAFGLTKAMEDESGKSAAIAGAHAVRLRNGFVMGKECISDEKHNFTHFLLVKKGEKSLPICGRNFSTAHATFCKGWEMSQRAKGIWKTCPVTPGMCFFFFSAEIMLCLCS